MKYDVEALKLQSWQAEAKAIVAEFRNALIRHFEIVDMKSRNLIESRWKDDG
jgi:hypothetical protein